MVAGTCLYGIFEKIIPPGVRDLRSTEEGFVQQALTPPLSNAIRIARRYSMDISIVATIGFTVAALLGIAVLFFMFRGGKGST